MALASHPLKLYIRSDATTPGASDEVAGANSVDLSPSIDILSATDFKDSTGAKKKIAGLTDGTISVGGDLDMTDAPQNLLRSLMLSGAAVYAQVHYNPSGSAGQKGYSVVCIAKSNGLSGAVDGKNTFKCDLEFNGVPALV